MRLFISALCLLLLPSLVDAHTELKSQTPISVLKPLKHFSKETGTCISCHKEKSSGIYQQWGRSKHFNARVGCYECHVAKATDLGATRHKDFIISVIVSPKKCGQCHTHEAKEFSKSHHARAGQIIGSLDNALGEVVEGSMTFYKQSPVTVNGCWQCHGSTVKLLPNGDLDPTTWPNTGIGRINLDGSKGSCTACHQRHTFSIAQARRPETCGKCHLGPDHPQKEIYDESKHGINFYSNVKRMNLDSSKWIPGEDYDAAPTCATCHMSATKDLPVTHDVGDRISWTLRPPISQKVDQKERELGYATKSWEQRRGDMKNVCSACHGKNMIQSFYEQFDALVTLYNNKFAIPGIQLMGMMGKYNLITDTPFDSKVKWTWFRIWHHSGRRARQGASMQAPDYVQWHGMFEVAQHFYSEFIPEVRELIERAKKAGNHDGAKKVSDLLEAILKRPEHQWYTGKIPVKVKKMREEQRRKFKERYLDVKDLPKHGV